MGTEDVAERLRDAIQKRLPDVLRAQVEVWEASVKLRARITAPDNSTLVEYREMFVEHLEAEPRLLDAAAEGMSNEAKARWEEHKTL